MLSRDTLYIFWNQLDFSFSHRGSSMSQASRVHDSLNNCEMRRNVIPHRDFNQTTNEKASATRRRGGTSKFRLVERVKRRPGIGTRLQWEYN